MASKTAKSSKKDSQSYHDRQMRRNQIIFGAVAVILILSMALSMVVNI